MRERRLVGARRAGYGDFFVAALAGAIAARQPSRQTLVAFGTTAFALAQYARSSDGDLLPETAPVAVAMVVATSAGRLRRRQAREAAVPAV